MFSKLIEVISRCIKLTLLLIYIALIVIPSIPLGLALIIPWHISFDAEFGEPFYSMMEWVISNKFIVKVLD